MSELDSKPAINPFLAIIIILAAIFIGFVVLGPIIGLFLSMPFYDGTLLQLTSAIEEPLAHPEIKNVLLIMQGTATLFGLIICPVVFAAILKRSGITFFRPQKFYWQPLVLTIIMVIAFMVVNSVFVEWNSNLKLPQFLAQYEKWAKDLEERAADLTQFMTTFKSTTDLLIALLVIAILPAIGEELVFRGMIQKEFYRGTGNAHLSIWIAAILFSAIHLQFYGFIPRMLLGALFGYLYYWSGSLWIAMVAHFINNGFSLLMMYFFQQGTTTFNVDDTQSAPLPVILTATLLTLTLLYLFQNFYQQRKALEQ